jgi:folylpolyglutamate synthase
MVTSKEVGAHVLHDLTSNITVPDLLSVNLDTTPSKLETQTELAAAWTRLLPSFAADRIHVLPSIEHAVQIVQGLETSGTVQALVTGSLHLVGGTIEVAGLSDVAL